MEIIFEEILTLVKKKMKENGAYDRDAYKQFVAESIDYFQERGKLTDDDNLDLIETQLMNLWTDIKDELSE